ncbi:MAG: NAD-dependent epimerase/dehydratase family protein [Proteobacteria bacterium]|nr:NAD-dependent epimerase/dehydratase family protein [Pseudomonadota bacterium]MBU1715648.1 NAD-dependent epimerase/dehydratase family protein [Pseudomonadota bacterium]
MDVIIITGSAGLIGSESAKYFHELGFEVVGIDNNLRKYFFGEDGSTSWQKEQLQVGLANYSHYQVDIRDYDELGKIFKRYGGRIKAVIHCAAQPSHDWAAKEPHTDFSVNAVGTLNMLEVTRTFCPAAVFIFTSTNKVYGDRPNSLPLVERELRWELAKEHPYFKFGIDEMMSIDQCKHSIFGASKIAADIMVQEYGRYFGMNTVTFRGGCLTGPAHSGTMLHGFLAYLVKCAVTDIPYTIFGYKGKQVRDNIHSNDLVAAFWQVIRNPRPGEVYNIGGGRASNCSVLEAIALIQEKTGRQLKFTISDDNRIGDHIWWISDTRKFEAHYPEWHKSYRIEEIIAEIIEATSGRL